MKKIMIVDDELLIRIGIISIIKWEDYGYTVVGEAASGQEALEKISQLRPDIVLTDLKMEPVDGFELIRMVRKQYPRIRFIVLSNYNDLDNVKKAMKLGASDYLFKLTLKPEEILSVLQEVSREQELDGGEAECEKTSQSTGPEAREQVFMLLRIVGMEVLDDGDEQQGKTVMLATLQNMLQELCSRGFRSQVTRGERNRFLIRLAAKDGGSPDAGLVDQLRRLIQQYIRQYFDFAVELAVSPCVVSESEQQSALLNLEKELNSRKYRQEILVVIKFVKEHMSENITVASAASLVNMSESRFAHVFKQEIGSGFIEYLNDLRMETAARLLCQPDLRISDVSEAVGIDNPSYFSTQFKKKKGVSPAEYRRRMTEIVNN